jgi:hypothetical protein
MRVKAYIPGTENVLVGEYNEWGVGEGGYLRIFDATGKHLNTLSLRAVDEWVIEPILELPTKRDALVRYTDGGGFSNTAWRHSADTAYPWSDASGGMDDDALMQEIKDHSDGKFTVIFEGLDD